jgi:hypothetical protein
MGTAIPRGCAGTVLRGCGSGGERFPGMEEVGGSNPPSSTIARHTRLDESVSEPFGPCSERLLCIRNRLPPHRRHRSPVTPSSPSPASAATTKIGSSSARSVRPRRTPSLLAGSSPPSFSGSSGSANPHLLDLRTPCLSSPTPTPATRWKGGDGALPAQAQPLTQTPPGPLPAHPVAVPLHRGGRLLRSFPAG